MNDNKLVTELVLAWHMHHDRHGRRRGQNVRNVSDRQCSHGGDSDSDREREAAAAGAWKWTRASGLGLWWLVIDGLRIQGGVDYQDGNRN